MRDLGADRGLVRHRQPAPVRTGDARGPSPTTRRRSSAAPRCGLVDPGHASWLKPVLTDADGHPRLCHGGQRRRRRASGSSPGCTRSRRPRCGSPASAPCSGRSSTCTRSTTTRDPVGRHRHGLHEPQPGRPRRPRVRVHRRPDASGADGRRRATGRIPRSRSGSAPGRGRPRPARLGRPAGSPGSATTCATSRSPRATRSRPSAGSGSASTPTGSATSRPRVDDATRTPRSTRSSRPTSTSTTSSPALRPGGERQARCATARGSRSASARFLRRRRVHRLHRRPSRTSTA